MTTTLVKVPPFTGAYVRNLSETDSHRVVIPPSFFNTVLQRNYAILPFYINEGRFKITPNGILYGEELVHAFDPPIADELAGIISSSPLKLFASLDDTIDSTIFGTVSG